MKFEYVKVVSKTGETGSQLMMVPFADDTKLRINWEQLKEMYKQGVITLDQMRQVGELRKSIIKYILGDRMNSPCYRNTGTDGPISDFDFNYSTYNTPNDTMGVLIEFYNKFYSFFGGMPDVVFDTNFYFCSTFITPKCHSEITNPNVLKLFREIGGIKHLYYNNNSKIPIESWEMVDSQLATLIFHDTMELKNGRYTTGKFSNMLKTGKIFYHLLDLLSNSVIPETYDLNPLILLLRIIVSFNAGCSNEAYVCDTTVGNVVYGLPYTSKQQMYVGYMDNFFFVKEWYEHHVKEDNFLGFFEIVSKYIVRCYDSIIDSDLKHHISQPLYTICFEWRKKVRGKVSLEKIMDETINEAEYVLGRKLLKELEKEGFKTVNDIYVKILPIYNIILKKFENMPSSVIQLYHDIEELIDTICVNTNANEVKSEINVNLCGKTYGTLEKTLNHIKLTVANIRPEIDVSEKRRRFTMYKGIRAIQRQDSGLHLPIHDSRGRRRSVAW